MSSVAEFEGLRAVLLDVDGTLVDSNEQHARSWCRALREHGFRAPYPVVRRLIGMGGDKLFPRMTGLGEDTAAGKAAKRTRSRIFRSEYLGRVRGFLGARELVERLRARGLRVVVASSSEPRDLAALLEAAGVAELVDATVSAADAARSKPDPGVVHAALARLRLPKRRVLMVGDTPYDVEAAALAGIRTVAVRCGGAWTDDELVGAVAIYDGPWELARLLATTPRVRGRGSSAAAARRSPRRGRARRARRAASGRGRRATG